MPPWESGTRVIYKMSSGVQSEQRGHSGEKGVGWVRETEKKTEALLGSV